MNGGPLRSLISNLASVGRQAFGGRNVASADIADQCKRLLEIRGEASARSLALQIIEDYQLLDEEGRLAFFRVLLSDFLPDPDILEDAIEVFQANPTPEAHMQLLKAADSRRQTLFRAINMARGGTAAIVAMREDLRRCMCAHPGLQPVDSDMLFLLRLWFNRGFLKLERIDWNTPAAILEKLIAYEAVHEIQGWEDLRRRLATDRRFFAFFHPALPDEPLVFVEVALMQGLTDSIEAVLLQDQPTENDRATPDTAIFYSINNCQPGLSGVSFGDFLIKHVADKLAAEMPHLKTFSTLSPIPGFRRWLDEALKGGPGTLPLGENGQRVLNHLENPGWYLDDAACAELEPVMIALCAHYLLTTGSDGEPLDPVARFHLRNGACLHRINWCGDLSPKGVAQSAGMLVNYVYDSKIVSQNHEAYVNDGVVLASSNVQQLVKSKVIAA